MRLMPQHEKVFNFSIVELHMYAFLHGLHAPLLLSPSLFNTSLYSPSETHK